MLFAMDIGNTNIKCGIFRNGELAHSFRVACDIDSTADEYGVKMKAFFSNGPRRSSPAASRSGRGNPISFSRA